MRVKCDTRSDVIMQNKLFSITLLATLFASSNQAARRIRDVSFKLKGESRSCANGTEVLNDLDRLLEPCGTSPAGITNDVHTKWDDSWYKDQPKSTSTFGCDCDSIRPSWDQYDPEISRRLDECNCGWRLSSGKCEQRRCSWGEALWTPTGTCISAIGDHASKEACPEGQKLYMDPNTGAAVCDCLQDHVYWPTSGQCYRIYSQGPCPQAMLLRLSDESQTPTCIPNPCLHDGLVGSYGWCYKVNSNLTLTLDSMPPPGKDAYKGKLCDDGCTPMIDPFTKSIVCGSQVQKETSRVPSPVFKCRKGSVAAWRQLC